jgi:predicted permease
MLMQMVNILGPIMIITLIGFLMGRSSVGLDTRTLSTVVIMVATPALIFHTLVSLHVAPDMMRNMAGAALLCVTIAGGLGLLILLLVRGPVRSFLPPLMLPNSGNMGLPLVVMAFGDEGMRLGVAYFFVVALVQNSVGLSIYSGTIRLSSLLRQPLIYSVIAVLVVTWTGIQVPQIILVTTEMLSGMMIPAMLMLLGASLATLKVQDVRPALFVAVGRLGLGLISALAVIKLLGLTGIPAGTVFLLATMPTAIVTYVFAERYQHDARQVAGSVVASTLLTFACLPVLIWIALAISDGTVDRSGMGEAVSSLRALPAK